MSPRWWCCPRRLKALQASRVSPHLLAFPASASLVLLECDGVALCCCGGHLGPAGLRNAVPSGRLARLSVAYKQALELSGLYKRRVLLHGRLMPVHGCMCASSGIPVPENIRPVAAIANAPVPWMVQAQTQARSWLLWLWESRVPVTFPARMGNAQQQSGLLCCTRKIRMGCAGQDLGNNVAAMVLGSTAFITFPAQVGIRTADRRQQPCLHC